MEIKFKVPTSRYLFFIPDPSGEALDDYLSKKTSLDLSFTVSECLVSDKDTQI